MTYTMNVNRNIYVIIKIKLTNPDIKYLIKPKVNFWTSIIIIIILYRGKIMFAIIVRYIFSS